MSTEMVFLSHALWMGVLITFIYDVLVIWRRIVPHKPLWEALEDLGFWVFCAVYVFMWLYRESNGMLRWYAVAGALLGMLCYKKIASDCFVKYMVRILEKVLACLWKILYTVTAPVRILRRKAAAVRIKARKRRKKIFSKIKIRLKSFINTLKIRLCKQ